MRNRPEVLGVLGDLLAHMSAVQDLHNVKNLKDAMMVIRPAWVDVEQSVSSRKVVDLYTIANKMLVAAGALAMAAVVIRETATEEVNQLAQQREKPAAELPIDLVGELSSHRKKRAKQLAS